MSGVHFGRSHSKEMKFRPRQLPTADTKGTSPPAPAGRPARFLGEGGPGANPGARQPTKRARHDRGRASEVEVAASRWSPSYAASL